MGCNGPMPDLAGRGPLGPKPDKPAKKPRKGIPPISKKRAAAMASKAWRDGIDHMARVKLLPCICCGHPPPSYAHHVTGDGMPRNHMRVLPLCYDCHQGKYGYHNDKASWVARHGPDYLLLDKVLKMLQN